MALNLKEFDWKNFLMMKGEFIGLGICIVVTLTIVIMSLFVPPNGFFVGSGFANAEKLKGKVKEVQNLLNTSKPSAGDLPGAAEKVDLAKEIIGVPEGRKYQVTDLFVPRSHADTRRRMPKLLLPDEGRAAVAHVQLKGYNFDRDFEKVEILTEKNGRGPAAANPQTNQVYQNMMNVRPGGGMMGGRGLGNMAPGTPMGAPPMGMQPGANPMLAMLTRQNPMLAQRFGQPGTAYGVAAANSTRQDLEPRMVPVSRLGDDFKNARLSETVLPRRMAIICASFPYKKQLEEFARQLQLPDVDSVLTEETTETDKDGNSYAVPTFRFKGVTLQRKVVDTEGKTISNWETIDSTKMYQWFLVRCGKRTEPEENQKMVALSFRGLVMKRLQQFRENQYPPVEELLVNLKKTLESMKTKEPEQVAAPSFFDTTGFDPFGAGEVDTPAANRAAMGPAGAGPAMPQQNGLKRGRKDDDDYARTNRLATAPRQPGPQAPNTPQGTAEFIPEYGLVRVIDLDVQPGKIYQYRIQVRMANPNYKNPNVAAPNYATEPELKTDQWFEIPDKVAVPPELLFYVVDQKDLDGRSYQGPNARLMPEKDRSIMMQMHKWLETIKDPNGERPIGEWIVAERIPVYKGEYISRKVICNVPEWMRTREEFVLATESTGRTSRRRDPGITVDFSQANNEIAQAESESILVDFEGGVVDYTRPGHLPQDKRDRVSVRDVAVPEALIMSPEGKLLSRNSIIDSGDLQRKYRLAAYRLRISEVRLGLSRNRTAPQGQNPGTPNSPFNRDR